MGRSWFSWLLALVAFALLAVALGPVSVPVSQYLGWLSMEGAHLYLYALAGFLVVYVGLKALVRRRTAPSPLVEQAPEELHGADVRQPGADVDGTLDALADPDRSAEADPGRLRESLRATAVLVLQHQAGLDEEAAERALDAGSWTDDARAAAFLGDDAPSPPLSVRVLDWLRTEHVQARRFRHALAELEQVELEGRLADSPVGKEGGG